MGLTVFPKHKQQFLLHMLEIGLSVERFGLEAEQGTVLAYAHGDRGPSVVRFFLHYMEPLICTVSDVWIAEEFRGKGLGQKLLQLREDIAQDNFCKLMLAGVHKDNAREQHILRKAGWRLLTPYSPMPAYWLMGKNLV
jgi:ribosomal protein S18 acetylase RimI-like enzyme